MDARNEDEEGNMANSQLPGLSNSREEKVLIPKAGNPRREADVGATGQERKQGACETVKMPRNRWVHG